MPLPLLLGLLLACPGDAGAMTLGEERRVQTAGGIKGALPDGFTKLLIYTDRHSGKPWTTVLPEALALMRKSHCALEAVAELLSRPGEVSSISFGETIDEHANYCPRGRTMSAGGRTLSCKSREIVVNRDKAYLCDPENLAKVLYHEGLHHAEFRLGFELDGGARPEDPPGERWKDGLTYHNAKRIPRIIEGLLGKGAPCLARVAADGTLLNGDGSLLEPAFAQPEVQPLGRSPTLDSLRR